MVKKAKPRPLNKKSPPSRRKEGANQPPETGAANAKVPETGGPKGPDPTRYGDWEIGGRCVDF